MKVSSDKILLEDKNFFIEKKVFLISGNEETLINKIERFLVEKFKLIGFDYVEKKENISVAHDSNKEIVEQLFSNSKIIIYKNPKDVNLDSLENSFCEKTITIITHNNLKSTSKIKKEFDFHKEYISISCYKLSREIKKKILDKFLGSNNVLLESDSYWYFVDNTSDLYQLFENEMLKLVDMNKDKISLKDMRELLSNQKAGELDRLFFSILKTQSDLFLDVKKSITNSADSYLFLQRIKFYFDLIINSKNINEASNLFPKYLFNEKHKYIKIYQKTDKEKLIKIYELIKKTELMLRKHSILYLPISQRFLINLKKHLK